jgi:arylsulfatase A-like enzyme
LKLLEETGQLDNTLVIMITDHVEMLGDHGIYLKGPLADSDARTVDPLPLRQGPW